MTDKELLELAAKAAGIEPATLYGENVGWYVPGRGVGSWNPLADDGDALRLACDLGLCIYPVARTMQGIACSAVSDAIGKRLSEVIDFSTNIQANTRRAIVLAAAEIGKNM